MQHSALPLPHRTGGPLTVPVVLVVLVLLRGLALPPAAYAQSTPIQVEATIDAAEEDAELAREILNTFSGAVADRGWQPVDHADTTLEAVITVRIIPPRALVSVTIRDRETGFLVAAVERRAAINLTLERTLEDAADELVAALEQIVSRDERDDDAVGEEAAGLPGAQPDSPGRPVIIAGLVPPAPPPEPVPVVQRPATRPWAVQLHSSSGRGPSLGAGFRWTPLRERLLVALEVDQGISPPVYLTDLRLHAGVRLGQRDNRVRWAFTTGVGTIVTALAGTDVLPFVDPYWQIIAAAAEVSLGPVVVFGRGAVLYRLPSPRGLLPEGISGETMPPQLTIGVMYPW